MKSLVDIRRQIEPVLQQVEQFRLEKLAEISKAKKWYFIPIMLLVFAALTIVIIPLAIFFGVAAIIGFIIITAFKVGPHKTAYIANFKQEVFQNFIKQLYPATYYAPANYMPSNLFSQSRLYGSYDSYNGEDYFEGVTESGAAFKFSELRVTDTKTTRDSDGDTTTTTTTIFDGVFFVLEVPNRVETQIQILPDTAEKGLGFLGKFVQKTLGSFFQGSKMVYMQDHPEFEKEFVVYCKNDEEAYRVLTPTLLQAIYDLRFKWNSYLSLSFIDNQIYIGLSTRKNLFEPDINKSVLDDNLLEELYDELALCLSVIEDLSVDNPAPYNPEKKIWEKKEEDTNPFKTPDSNRFNKGSNDGDNKNPFLM